MRTTAPSRKLAAPIESGHVRFTKRGAYNLRIDSRGMLQIAHEPQRVRAGDFAAARFSVPSPRAFRQRVYLRFHASNAHLGDPAVESGRRFLEMWVEGQCVWRRDVYRSPPTQPGKRFDIVEITRQARGRRELALEFRLVEQRIFKPDYPLRVFFGPLSIHAGARPGPHPADRPVHLARLRPKPGRPQRFQKNPSVPVMLDLPSRPPAAAEPVSFGVPFPAGALRDPKRLQLVLGKSRLPTQTVVLTEWPDGSSRWVLIDTLLPAGRKLPDAGRLISARLPAPQARQAGQPGRGPAVTARRTQRCFVIDTGAAGWTIDPRTFLKHSLRISMLTADGIRHRAGAADTAAFERAGPVRATLILDGWLNPARSDRIFRYRLALNFFAGSANVRAELALTSYQQRGRRRMVKNRKNEPGTGDDFIRRAVRAIEVELPFAFSTAARVEFPGTYPGGISVADRPVMEQLSSRRYRLVAMHRGKEYTLGAGARAAGAALVRDGAAAVSLRLTDFAERHPKEIAVHPGGLRLSLWPRRHAEPWLFAQGQAAAWRFEFCTGPEAVARARQTADLQYRRMPPIIYPAPAWTAASNALGPLATWQQACPQSWKTELAGIARNMQARTFDGEEDFGDYALSWGYQRLVHNNEYDVAHGAFVAFAASGYRPLYDIFRAKVIHYRDTDIIHFCPRIPEWYRVALNTQYRVPVGRRRDLDIWTGGAHHHHKRHTYEGASPCHTWLRSLLDHFHQTGDRRTLEIARAVGDYMARMETMAVYRSGLGGERWIGWMLIALTAIYEETLDRQYLDAARACIERAMNHAHPVRGGYAGGATFQSGVLSEGLLDYYRITGDEQVAEFILRLTRWLIEEMALKKKDCFYYYQGIGSHSFADCPMNRAWARAFLFAYDRTGEKRFLDWARCATTPNPADGRLLQTGVHVLFPYELSWSAYRARARARRRQR